MSTEPSWTGMREKPPSTISRSTSPGGVFTSRAKILGRGTITFLHRRLRELEDAVDDLHLGVVQHALLAALADQVLDLLLETKGWWSCWRMPKSASTARVDVVRKTTSQCELRARKSRGGATSRATVSVKRRARALGTSSPRISST